MIAPPLSRPVSPGRDVPALYRGIAQAATRSRAAAVKLFCLECVGYVRADVTGCTAPHCPLFRWRPYQSGAEDDALPPEISGVRDPEAMQEAADLFRGAGGSDAKP